MATPLELTDRLMDGELQEALTRWRGEGLSFDAITRKLSPFAIVSRETVRRWCVKLDIA